MKNLLVGLLFVLSCQVAFAAELECSMPAVSKDEAVSQAKEYLYMGYAFDVSAVVVQLQADNIKTEKEKDPSNEAVQRLLDKATRDKESYEMLSRAMNDLYECSIRQIAGK